MPKGKVNGIRSTKKSASIASKILRGDRYSKDAKTVAGETLNNRKKRSK